MYLRPAKWPETNPPLDASPNTHRYNQPGAAARPTATTMVGRKPTQYESLLAGIIAGSVEGGITYPAEYLKTKAQFASSKGSGPSILGILTETLRTRGVQGLYSGAGALIVGNGLKAGVRFMTYDSIKEVLRDDQGKLSPGRTLVAGLCAGVVEAAVAVTPSETIKTKLIQDASSSSPMYTNLVNGTIGICRTEGFGGIYRGLGPTIMKQGANSAVRFSSYAALQQQALQVLKPESGKLSSATTFAVGAGAGLITVYSTMPLDNIKTRMQSVGAAGKYKNSLDCLRQIVTQEGVARLWGGTTPRLARLMASGGIVFAVYEKLIDVMTG
ncbi:mitochondrial carrier domain-containing protein [Papiliotrema laurentii]|uniref:Mitochondrial carrier domain-containing protein n=1 Tax=Papiliotrema laurentii TaxID=5418 RepID=A0AAD9FQW5_PAPLA|nr:mitochondrial carrier domain-containing protein [Papiliotrema laurentii]